MRPSGAGTKLKVGAAPVPSQSGSRGVVQKVMWGHQSPSRPILFPSPFFPSPFLPLPFPPHRSWPLIAARRSGERFGSPSGSGRSPAAKRYLVNIRLKISALIATIFSSVSGNETLNCRTGWRSDTVVTYLIWLSFRTAREAFSLNYVH